MLKSEMNGGGSTTVGVEERKPSKRPAQASSRKGCMRGKGGPENATCTYKGVRQRTWGKWVAEIREPNRGARLWIGTFDSSHEAALACDAAARKLYGSEAKLKLPEQRVPHGHQHHLNKHLQNQVVPSPANPGVPPQIPNQTLVQNNPSGTGTNPAGYADQPHGNWAVALPEQGGTEVGENMSSGGNNEMEGILWENTSGNFPVFDDSIWTEATMSLDFPAMEDYGVFGGGFLMELAGKQCIRRIVLMVHVNQN
ncbi:dehydration-responsive element-binding protein 2D-like [Pyrus ussuriensis x Pyrus communis]|uniref:Dehydration-responsive element-binding protein 2D-like n=1 Tax=Pyrus ussuriensis x Pyrus communis TaxID=2448454 RepID=A0A5N5HPL6_9ROSA|nr:dehydration-responsive element-binding protein 2D-like [Pyrus ussuriensis x Pyrus communis]